MNEKNVEKKLGRTLSGKVISDKMERTVVVLVTRKIKHPMYGKYVQRSTKIHAHDAENTCKEGDTVIIAETRPISKTKKWKVVEVCL